VRFHFVPAVGDKDSIAQFFWDYRKPDVQQIISDGRTMWVYLPDNKQVIESDIAALSQQQGQNPVTFLSSLGQLSAHFDISWGEKSDKDGNYRLYLQPRLNSQLIEQMEVIVNRKAVDDWSRLGKTGVHFPILTTTVTDQQGNRTTIHFEQIKVNVGLKNEQFIFSRPDDVELVRPEQMNF
jgi:outer membrane lipoprotein carrier protein